jgi:hypothetical protein
VLASSSFFFDISYNLTDLVCAPFSFNVRRLQNLTASPALTIQPAVNQVELNYWNPQPELVAWSKAHNILLEAYSPLGGDGMVAKTLRLPVVQKIAKKLKITPAQVIISWHVQRGTVVLPKSVDLGRISENYQREFATVAPHHHRTHFVLDHLQYSPSLRISSKNLKTLQLHTNHTDSQTPVTAGVWTFSRMIKRRR